MGFLKQEGNRTQDHRQKRAGQSTAISTFDRSSPMNPSQWYLCNNLPTRCQRCSFEPQP